MAQPTALPEHLREKLGVPDDTAKEEERKKLYAIEDPKAFYAAATEYLKSHELPGDPRLLDRLLGHPDDDVIERALTRLEEMHKAGTLKVPGFHRGGNGLTAPLVSTLDWLRAPLRRDRRSTATATKPSATLTLVKGPGRSILQSF